MTTQEEEEFEKAFKILFGFLVEERKKFLLYVSDRDPEVGFPLVDTVAELQAIEQLKVEGKIPPFYEEFL